MVNLYIFSDGYLLEIRGYIVNVLFNRISRHENRLPFFLNVAMIIPKKQVTSQPI